MLRHTRHHICFSLLMWSMVVLTPLLRFVSPVQAQAPFINISVSPPLSVADYEKESPVRLAFTYTNNSPIDLIVTTQLKRFSSDQLTGTPVIDQDATVPPVRLESEEREFSAPFPLPAGQKKQIVMLITPPANAQRDIPLILLATMKPNLETQLVSSSTKVEAVLGANIILRNKTASFKTSPISLTDLTGPAFFDVLSPITLELTAHNDDATVHQIRGTVSLKRGEEVTNLLTLFPDLILSDSSRTVRALASEGNEKDITPIVFAPPHMPGQYTLEVTMLQENGKPKVYTKTIYIVPFSLVIGGLGLIMLLLFLRALLKRRSSTR